MTFGDFLLNVRFADLLDIFIVGVLLGLLLHWGKRRKNPAIFVVGVLLVGIYVTAFSLDLYMTRTIVPTAVSALLFALIVLFQNELRFELDQVLRWRPLSGQRSTVGETAIEAIAKAIELMASEKIGALLVFPRNQSIEPYCRAGSRVDAEVSVELLHSIFHPQSQGHDGAVIILNERIARIGVHLPLSTDLAKIKHLGTRHCAALGLSERTDAVVCVLSEEKGTTSFASGGELTLANSDREVMEQLRLLSANATHSNSLAPSDWTYSTVIEHAAIALLALGLSALLWFMFAFEIQTIQRTIADVPVELHNLPDGWEVDGPYPSSVTLSLVGPKRALSAVDAVGVKVVVDLQSIAVGQTWVRIGQDHIRVPVEVKLHSAEPSNLRLQLQRAKSFKKE